MDITLETYWFQLRPQACEDLEGLELEEGEVEEEEEVVDAEAQAFCSFQKAFRNEEDAEEEDAGPKMIWRQPHLSLS